MFRHLIVFDIETIPDTEAYQRLTGYKSDDVQELRKKFAEYHLDITDGRNSFLRQPFHKVIVIGMLIAEIVYADDGESFVIKEIVSGSIGKKFSEKTLLESFFNYFSQKKPRLVSFNGRTFDLPVLRYRAMKYNISCSTLYTSGDKWNNYTNRYSHDWHCDLLEVLSDYGASARIRMQELCAILNLPGKIGLEGSMVAEMYDLGKIEEISNYCETDVLNTYLIYLRWLQHQGRISNASYKGSLDDLERYVTAHMPLKEHFRKFYHEWQL